MSRHLPALSLPVKIRSLVSVFSILILFILTQFNPVQAADQGAGVSTASSAGHSHWRSGRHHGSKKPKAPKTISPKGTTSIAEETYRWKPVTDADSYELVVRQKRNELLSVSVSATDANCASGEAECSFNPGLTLEDGRYQWRVRAASSDDGVGKWSSYRSYRVRNVVVPQNQAPVATDQSANTDKDVSVAIELSASDADGNALTYNVDATSENGGTVVVGTAPNVTYTPPTGFTGTDTFTYTVNDGTIDSNTATVSILVNNTNTAPDAADQLVSVDEDGSVDITLIASDADNDVLTYTLTQPTNGTLDGTAPDLSYTPTADFNGTDSFEFSVSDGLASSSVATVTITVNSVNDEPVANAQSIIVDEDSSVDITLEASDVDGDDLVITVAMEPLNGSLSGTEPNLIYTPDEDYSGSDSFIFSVNDGSVETAVEVSITINPIPEQPQNLVATPGNLQVQLDWDVVDDAESYMVCLSDSSIFDALDCENGTLIPAPSNSLLIDSSVYGDLQNGTTYYFAVLAVATTDDGSQIFSEPSTEVSSTLPDIVEPTPTGRLNDTGITVCGDYAYGGSGLHDSNVDCSLAIDDEGDPVPVGQDGHYGRDADITKNDPTNGHVGFDFTKIGENGAALEIQDQAWDVIGSEALGTQWSCVKDNVTGLIWEIKTDDDGVRDKGGFYTWYQLENNGGNPGVENVGICHADTGSCDTTGYAAKINTDSLCGATDWRLPTRTELSSIVNHEPDTYPPIDGAYFPNTTSAAYWSSSPSSGRNEAWLIDFQYYGNARSTARGNYGFVRLVRGSQ